MTSQDEGSYFEPKHLEQVRISYLHFSENRPSQAKATLGVGVNGESAIWVSH